MAKVSDKYLRDLLRVVVSFRANNCCEFPGCVNCQCDPHHWASKKNNSIRNDYDACLNLCVGHHTGNQLSAHKSPRLFKLHIINCGVRTQAWADKVEQKARQAAKDTAEFREECKEKLLAEMKRLGVRGWRK